MMSMTCLPSALYHSAVFDRPGSSYGGGEGSIGLESAPERDPLRLLPPPPAASHATDHSLPPTVQVPSPTPPPTPHPTTQRADGRGQRKVYTGELG
jgi:hypothetical protein